MATLWRASVALLIASASGCALAPLPTSWSTAWSTAWSSAWMPYGAGQSAAQTIGHTDDPRAVGDQNVEQQAPPPAPGPHMPVLVYRGGGVIVAGEYDDGPRWVSADLGRRGYGSAPMPAFEGTDAEWTAMLTCAQNRFAGLPIDLVDEAPDRPYMLVVVGGTASHFGLTDLWGWATTGEGSVVERGVGFVFSADHHITDRGTALCETLAHEVGHLAGLPHSDDCSDLMATAASCGVDYTGQPARQFTSSRGALESSLTTWAAGPTSGQLL